MKTIIKIHSIEITIEDEAAAPAAITTATTQAVVEALRTTPWPVPVSTVQPKTRKVRMVEPAPTQPEPSTPAVIVEPQATQIPPTDGATPELIQQPSEPPKKRLPFEEFDKLVRSEMKRLAPSPGQMPSHNIWNEMRTPPLPTLGAVISRYDCVDLNGLAKELGMNPPLGKPGPVPAKAITNGAA